MDPSQRDRLSQLVEELTMSGQLQLNQEKMKEIKKICKMSNDCIDHVYHLVMSQLNQDHSEIRLSALQITSELFSRSHHFRTLVVNNFQEVLELTVETDSEQPLPPPKEVARKLRALAIQTVQAWYSSYGEAYKKLALGYHFLKKVKKVDFQDTEARTEVERTREAERHRRMEAIYKERVEAASKDMEDLYQEIETTLKEMESCMKLLFPEFDDTDIQSRPQIFQSASECESADEQPCCSRDLAEDGKETMIKEKQEEKICAEETRDEDDHMTDRPAKKLEEEEDDEEEEEGHNEDEGYSFIRSSGLISHSYSLDLTINPDLRIKENEDNEAVVSTLIELHRLLSSKHLPAVQGWIQVFTKSGAEQQLIRRALYLKQSIEAALQKHEELHIDYKSRVRRVMKASSDGEDDDDDDDDFEEVPEKEGYEPNIPEHLRAEYGLDPSPSTSTAPVTTKSSKQMASSTPLPSSSSSSSSASARRLKRLLEEQSDPTCVAATLQLRRQLEQSSFQSTSSTRSSKAAPVVPFGLDLYYWGEEQPNVGKIFKSSSQHQFWAHAPMEEEVENKELLAESRSRYISFPGSFTPVSHFCRARLDNGLLCQRQDRFKCPFHGRIIPRDAAGLPLNEGDRLREEREARRKREEEPDWRDPELMRDIELATGEDLGSDRAARKGKGKKKKYPNLTDLKQSSSTSRFRLEKKIFNKSAMRRVAQVMNKADSRKHDKFSNQFNYALK
ncbi:UV-stimulated scaffold protein A isoform X1 [Takifugu flavidus]|uniref:UV-stimulated scaffold protein A isoform X1 n=1 Tax=Takifugu flavidus TaxID=433684 RepID=UPI00254444E4|nr:UV-stimulated scaffold protein A isoform X1 [Takifugu flavidus]